MVCLERYIKGNIAEDDIEGAVVMAQGHTFCQYHYGKFIEITETRNNALLDLAEEIRS
jgi:hypothetical protein